MSHIIVNSILVFGVCVEEFESIAECFAESLINAAKGLSNSYRVLRLMAGQWPAPPIIAILFFTSENLLQKNCHGGDDHSRTLLAQQSVRQASRRT